MKPTQYNLRGRLALCTALTLAGSLGLSATARAQTATTTTSTTATTPVVIPGEAAPTNANAQQLQEIQVTVHKLLLREKDIPNAVTELGQKQIQAANPTTGSIQTLLKQAPSVVAYSQQPGQDTTTLAIRGVRNDELAETLDGIPINNLLNGSGDYIDVGIGSPVTLNEIDGVTIYPGLAPPANQGFGTTGGTIAYSTKQPTDYRYEELEGGFGSFDTQHIGFTVNTGKMGDGPDAPKALILYDQSQTAGYVSDTPAQFHDFLFNVVKPYDNGNSKLGLVIIFNQGKGLVQTSPSPTALIQKYGYKFNFPISDSFFAETDQNLSVILSDHTYINPYAIFDSSLFFRHETNTTDNYSAANNTGFTYGGNTYSTNVQALYGFYGCVGTPLPGDTSDSVNPGGTYNTHNGPGFTYSPAGTFGSCAAGESDIYEVAHNNIVGITPKLTLFPDAHNTIVIGGLIAKANSGGTSYVYGGDGAAQHQEDGYNSFLLGGGSQRTIFSGYAQDTVRAFDDKLQITGGVKVDAAYSSVIQQVQEGILNPAKLQNFTKIGGYYFGGSYNLPHDFVLFASGGKGSLFAPTNNYSVGTTSSGLANGTSAPTPEIVHLYEGGIRYDTPRLLLSTDYYYQAIANGFAFFENFLTNQQFYANNGGYLFRGVEGNGAYKITPNLSVFGNFSYNETEYTKNFFASDTLTQDQFGYAFTGTPLSNVPNWNGLIGVDYNYGPFSAEVTGQYTGREFITDDLDAPPYGNTFYVAPGVVGNAQYPNGAPTSQFPGDTKVPENPLDAATVTDTKIQNPANFLVNLLLSYKIPVPNNSPLKSVTATLNLQNLLDERYNNYQFNAENPVNGIYDPNLPGGQPYGEAFVGEPRSFTVDLVAKF